MNSFTTYIIYSQSINRFYIGSTSMQIDQRINKHNSNHGGYTAKANDWKVVFLQHFSNVSDSRKLERKIKGRGAKRFLISISE